MAVEKGLSQQFVKHLIDSIIYKYRDLTSSLGGELILGESDSRYYTGCLHHVPLSKKTYWQLNVTR